MQASRLLSWSIPALALAGCAHIASVKPASPPIPVGSAESGQLRQARQLERTDSLRALGDYLASAQAASRELRRDPSDKQARDLYNFAVARSIDVIEEAKLSPWDHALTVPGPHGQYSLSAVRHAEPDRDPANYEIVPTDTLSIGGTYFITRVSVPGVGAPVVAIGREETKDFRKTFTSRRTYGTATGILRFDQQRARLEFLEPFKTEHVTLGGRTYPLAADFTTPAAVALTREHPEKLGLIRFLRPEKYAETARLTRLQAYDANRIPVIFVHGLQDTPASWVPMINALREDPDIRRRYQFWVYSYPSGYPYPYSAALLRRELDAVGRAFPDHKGIVLIGHSMGGMISRLMITDVGDKIWRARFGKAPSETNIPGETRKLLEESLVFHNRLEVRRVIFICAPHRGSEMATNWIGRIATRLVKTPLFFATLPIRAIQAASVDPATQQLTRIPNSIDTLSPDNRFVKEIDKIPITPGVPFHTIEGDRGRGDAPNSSDGVVPYWSSHLPGAQSELIVPSNHSAPRNPQAIAEVRRILKAHR